MRVLLINPPPFHRVDQYDEPDFPQLGLACLAGELEAHGIGSVAVVDAKLERLGYGEVLDRVRAFRPDVVGLTAMTNEVIQAGRVAALIKQADASIVTVIGGIHVSVLPESTMAEFSAFDLGVLGDGEVTLRELVTVLGQGGDIRKVSGLIVREGNDTVRTGVRPRVADLDRLGAPAWHLFPPARRYMFSTQRGCPFQCPFCVNPNGRRPRQRSIQRVVDEMVMLVERFGARTLYMCDEVFTLDRERTMALMDAMIRAGLPGRLEWTAATHVQCVDREVLVRMKAAGCRLIELGIESGDPDILARLHKGVTIEAVHAARRAAAEAGIPFGALMILGHPDETWRSAWRTLDLAVALNSDQTIFGVMVPFPGTLVGQMAQRGEGGYRLIARDWNDYGKQHGHAVELVNLSRRQLELLQGIGYLRVLLENGRLADFARFGWRFRREALALGIRLATGGRRHDRGRA